MVGNTNSSKFPAEHLSLLLEWFTPFLLPLFLLYSILVSSFYLSINIVVLYQFTVTCIAIWSVRSLGRIKSSRLWLFFDNVPENIACSRPSTISERLEQATEKKGMDLWKQMIVYIFFSLCLVCILHQACILLSVCSLHFTLCLSFYPWSAVSSLQFAFYTDWFSIYTVSTGTFPFAMLLKPSFINVLISFFCFTQNGGSSYCYNFDKIHDTAPLIGFF